MKINAPWPNIDKLFMDYAMTAHEASACSLSFDFYLMKIPVTDQPAVEIRPLLLGR